MRNISIVAVYLCLMIAQGLAAGQAAVENKEQLLEKLVAAHDAADFDAIAELIEWRGISRYKRKMVKVYTRSTFGRPIKSTSFEKADTEYLRRFSLGPKTYASNMEVSYLMRLEFDEETLPGEEVASVVFLVGQDAEGYKIALTAPVKK